MKNNQKGFGAVEALLIVVIVLLVGFIGYYVWHTSNSANTAYDNAAKPSTSASKASSTPQLYYFKELGVYITLTGPPLKGNLDYELSTIGEVQYLDLFTPDTQTALNACDPGATGGVFMSIAKIPGQFNQNDNPGVANLKQFKDFWISGASPNGIVCADSASQKDKDNWLSVFHEHIKAVQDAFKTATQ